MSYSLNQNPLESLNHRNQGVISTYAKGEDYHIILKKRLKQHNKGTGAKFTRGRKWKLIFKEKLGTKNKAISREYYIKKNRTLRNFIKKRLIRRE